MKATMKRWTARIALPLAALLAATVVGDGAAYGKPSWTPPAGTDVTGIAATHAQAVATNSWTAESLAIRGARAVVWPAGEATVDLATVSADGNRLAPKAGNVAAGSLPVKLAVPSLDDDGRARRAAHAQVAKATVKVHDRAVTAKAGVQGLLVSVARADGHTRTDKLTVHIGYAISRTPTAVTGPPVCASSSYPHVACLPLKWQAAKLARPWPPAITLPTKR